MIQQRNPDRKLRQSFNSIVFAQRVKTIIAFDFTLAYFASLFCFFPVLLLVKSYCCLNHLSADDETSNVLKRAVKNVRRRFGSLLYVEIA